jgi:hypothetical protein
MVTATTATTPTANYGVQGGTPSKAELAGKSPEELKGMLKDPSLSAEQKQAVLEALAEKAQQEQKSPDEAGGGGGPEGAGDGGGEEDEDSITSLMGKLKDGSITPEQQQKLAGKLGVDAKDLDGMKGGGQGGGGAPADGGDHNMV